jgi:hypothetical protein
VERTVVENKTIYFGEQFRESARKLTQNLDIINA